jgi:hypothetical protein
MKRNESLVLQRMQRLLHLNGRPSRVFILLVPFILAGALPSTVVGSTLQTSSRPERVLNITAELVEIDGQGSIVPVERSRPTIAGIWIPRPSDQVQELAEFSLGGDQCFRISVAAEEIGDESSLVRLMVEELPGGRILEDEEVRLQTSKRQEILVAVADSTVDNTTLAVRLVPSLQRVEPTSDYSGSVEEFGMNDGLYIVDSTDLRARASSGFVGVWGANDAVLALVIDDPKYGRFTLSYRPFPDAVRAGYIDGHRIAWNWEGNLFELISIENPFLPKGKWNLFVRREASNRAGAGLSGISLHALRVH